MFFLQLLSSLEKHYLYLDGLFNQTVGSKFMTSSHNVESSTCPLPTQGSPKQSRRTINLWPQVAAQWSRCLTQVLGDGGLNPGIPLVLLLLCSTNGNLQNCLHSLTGQRLGNSHSKLLGEFPASITSSSATEAGLIVSPFRSSNLKL